MINWNRWNGINNYNKLRGCWFPVFFFWFSGISVTPVCCFFSPRVCCASCTLSTWINFADSKKKKKTQRMSPLYKRFMKTVNEKGMEINLLPKESKWYYEQREHPSEMGITLYSAPEFPLHTHHAPSSFYCFPFIINYVNSSPPH